MGVGRVEQIGSPREIYECPANRFVAEFIGETNLIPGKITSSEPNAVRVSTELGDLLSSRSCDLAVGTDVFCSIRPEATRIVGDASPPNVFLAKITHHTYLGETNQFVFDAAGLSLRAMSLGESADASRGSEVRIGVEPDDIVVLSRS
jgi:ABC-type Fe3+/spermidine/putrescine transport system ATPase subunit